MLCKVTHCTGHISANTRPHAHLLSYMCTCNLHIVKAKAFGGNFENKLFNFKLVMENHAIANVCWMRSQLGSSRFVFGCVS